MGKNKLRKFAEMEDIDFVFQYPYSVLALQGFPLRGRWREHFGNDNPIVLELGCGKGEYTVGLARINPGINYIGIDIKGARMHTGATAAVREGLKNVAFVRTSIELLDHFFAPGEVSEIWITFPDPQMKKVRKRLTGTRFLDLYRRVLADSGTVHLKTDSPFLYTYTTLMLGSSGIQAASTDDLYHSPLGAEVPPIRTHYEQQWLARGLNIKYVRFQLRQTGDLVEPQEEIPFDTYRSYSRGIIQSMTQSQDQQ